MCSHFPHTQPAEGPRQTDVRRRRSAGVWDCGGFHGAPVGMLSGASPLSSFHGEGILPYVEQPKMWLNNVIKVLPIYLLSHTQRHFIRGRFSHDIKLRKKAFLFLSPKASSNFYFMFHWPELRLKLSPVNSVQGEYNHHHWLRLIRICPRCNGEEEKMPGSHHGSAGMCLPYYM